MDANEARPVIRVARPDEYAAIGELTVDVYVGEGHIDPASAYVPELRDTARRAPLAEVLVAEYRGQVVGSLTIAAPGTPYAETARPDELEFRMLAVAKAARGLGVGTALVRTVIDRAIAESYAAVMITTMPTMTDAMRIYERFGFVRVPERDWITDAGNRLPVLRLDLVANAERIAENVWRAQ
ncbi:MULTISPECIES: GNAT family N-acetyltransferase [unclassified Nocardia]|uniref:GNAT family N-acetyltransferase n=1 Tax=unclassified Nocardia TaxID=2637762 RepID=UPI001CE3D9AD|nr:MULTISPECIES: GNAT family N-acetyltransferase [unclassified Nocardia]